MTASPWIHIHGRYDKNEDMQSLYARPSGEQHLSHPFGTLARVKLILILLGSHGSMGAKIDPLAAMRDDADCPLVAFFPLHDRERLEALKAAMFAARPWALPLDELREYFGEKIALYFAWVGYLTTCLGIQCIAALGVGVWSGVHVSLPNFRKPARARALRRRPRVRRVIIPARSTSCSSTGSRRRSTSRCAGACASSRTRRPSAPSSGASSSSRTSTARTSTPRENKAACRARSSARRHPRDAHVRRRLAYAVDRRVQDLPRK